MLRTAPSRYAPRRPPVVSVQSLPAPVGGLNARDTLAGMSPTDAVILDNWFPQRTGVELRRGFITWSGELADSVETLMTYSDVDGTQTLFAIYGGEIFDVTVTGVPVTTGVSGLTNDRFQYTGYTNAFDNFIVLVNGEDQPKKYNGTAWTDATYTGIADDANLISVIQHHRRLWFVEKESSSAWFGNTDEIQGELTRYDFGEMFPRGGYLMALGSWSVDAGDGLNDLLVAVSSEGDVVVMQGIDPLDFSFQKVGQYYAGKPLGRRCIARMLSELLILTVEGLIPMSSLLAAKDQSVKDIGLTDKIQSLLIEDTVAFQNEFGWEVLYLPQFNQLYINVPDTDAPRQYVMNTVTKAWCRFLGYHALTFAVFGNQPFFGYATGVAKAYIGSFDSWDEAEQEGIEVSARAVQAFSNYGSANQKHFRMARPVFLGHALPTIQFNLAVDYEFDENELNLPSVVSSPTGSVWDTGIWDLSVWGGGLTTFKRWYGLSPIGFCGAPALVLNARTQTFWVATDVLYETGGVL